LERLTRCSTKNPTGVVARPLLAGGEGLQLRLEEEGKTERKARGFDSPT
jgi:hypothetical protein